MAQLTFALVWVTADVVMPEIVGGWLSIAGVVTGALFDAADVLPLGSKAWTV